MGTTDITTAQAVIGSIDQPAWVLDRAGEIATINEPALATFGYAPDEVLGRCSHDRFHHSHLDGAAYARAACPIVAQTPRGHGRGNDWFIRKSGAVLPASWARSPLCLDDAEMTLITLRVLDGLPESPVGTPEPARRVSVLERRALHRAACDLITARATDPELAPAGIARELHVSLRHLQAAFAEAGDTPAQRIRTARLTRAADLIRSGLTVAEVVDRTGFADPSTFRRAFRRHFGAAPTQLRAAV